MEKADSPFKQIEDKLDILIENPEAARAETLNEIKSMVQDLRTYFEEEDDSEMEDDMPEEDDGKGGILITIGKAMKKKMALLAILALCSGKVFAAVMDPIDLPRPNMNVTSAIFNTTNTFQTTVAAAAVISSYSAILEYVTVNSTGTGSWIEIFDTSISTSSNGIKKIGKINTAIQGTYWYDAHLSSGLAINHWATSPSLSDVTVGYRQRR